ncbi:MAG: DUF1641 domain-containing protein [Acidimicrobiia bacterium]
MTTTLDTDRVAELEAKLDRLTEHVEFLADHARQESQRREMISELLSDLSPIATQAMGTLTEELATTDLDMVKMVRLLKRFAESAETLDAGLAQLQAAHGLFEDIMPLTGDAFVTVTERLADLEQRGYFTFVREGLGVMDRVITTYDEDDIRALGENIVLILDTVRQMTQPEVMTMLSRTFDSMEETEFESASLFQLARQMRDPEVKRGLARMIGMLRTMGADEPKPPATS